MINYKVTNNSCKTKKHNYEPERYAFIVNVHYFADRYFLFIKLYFFKDPQP